MTGVKFLTENGRLCGFSVTGHSSKDCDDIDGKLVCSAVSSAAYMAANTVLEVIGDQADTSVGDARMDFRVKNPSEKTDVVLRGFRLHIKQLAVMYSDRIKVYSEV